MPVEIREIQLKADVVSGRQQVVQAKADGDCGDDANGDQKVPEKERDDIIDKALERMIQWYEYNKNR